MLNQEMKNPHLVETMVTVEPTTGRKIQEAEDIDRWLAGMEFLVYSQKMSGLIPRIELNFNIQGIPLVLTAQSYLTLRMTPKFTTEITRLDSLAGSPLETEFEINRSGWPKINSQVIDKVQATISNMGTEAYYGFYLNYIRSLRLSGDLRENMSRQYNNNYCAPTVNTLIDQNAQNNYQTYEYRTRGENSYLFACSIERIGIRSIQWTKDNTFEVRIPLAEILPLFQIPVLPLAQTNTSGIQLRMTIFSPKHLFFMSRCFKTNLIWNNYSDNHLNYAGLRAGEARMVVANALRVDDAGMYNGIIFRGGRGVVSTPQTLIGFDKNLLESITPKTMITSDTNSFFACDIETEAFLNLKVLSNPLLNPLAEAYIQPFINEMNEFRTKFETSAIFNQTLVLKPNIPTIFRFTPSRLFYNATQIGLFFFTQTKRWTAEQEDFLPILQNSIETRPINSFFTELDPAAGPIHGYYTLPPTVGITDFQIGLSSSATPLFDRPLDKIGMLSATEDCFKKYNPSEMFGKVIQNRKRLSEGDAFFLFDLTHTRDSGYFIDADNLITVGGTLTYNRMIVDDRIGVMVDDFETAEELTVQVIMVVFYQETFTVLLDLEGAVLFQQT